VKYIDSIIQKLESQAKFYGALSPCINFVFPLLFSSAVDWWCHQFLRSASNWDTILFDIGIGSSVGIVVSMILNGILSFWDGFNSLKILDILNLPGNHTWMRLVYGIGSLPAFYFWAGAYIVIVKGGSSGVIGGTICAIVSILTSDN
jgi:ABC-type Co2+ transport system permease subunit